MLKKGGKVKPRGYTAAPTVGMKHALLIKEYLSVHKVPKSFKQLVHIIRLPRYDKQLKNMQG